MRLEYSKATVYQQRTIKEFVVGCARLYYLVFPNLELAVLSIVRKLTTQIINFVLHSSSSTSAINVGDACACMFASLFTINTEESVLFSPDHFYISRGCGLGMNYLSPRDTVSNTESNTI